ncbi:hypothetical protein MBLNU230_g1515t1 [Neophaeotheca triangularis]
MSPTQEKEKKSKLGRIFGSGGSGSEGKEPPKKTDQHISRGDEGKSQYLRPSQESYHDSAYGSSESANKGASGENIVHVDNTGQIDGVDEDRSLAYNKSTGDVFDEDTGETVVTTTTTTTTTTTHRPGGKKELKTEVKTDGGEPVATAASQGNNTGVQELPANPSPAPPMGRGNDSPPVPVRNPQRRRSMDAAESPVSPQSQTSPQNQQVMAPAGGPYGHTAQSASQGSAGQAAKTNFSYPHRQEPPPTQPNMATGGPPPEHEAGNRGTMHNLKAAAMGIHGVGETLRGTLNSESDRHLMPRSNPKKAAAADAKNQAALEKGRTEMAGLRARNGLAPSVSPHQQQQGYPPPPQDQQQPAHSPPDNFNTSPPPPPPQNQSNIHPAQRDQFHQGGNGGGAPPSYDPSSRPPPNDYGYYDQKPLMQPPQQTQQPQPPVPQTQPQPQQGRPPIPQQQPPPQSPPNSRPQPSEYGVPYAQSQNPQQSPPQTANPQPPTTGGPAGGGMPPEHYGPYKEAQPHLQPQESNAGNGGNGKEGEKKHGGLGKLFKRKPVAHN